MQVREVESLARATLAQGLIQIVLHFPEALAALELSAEQALQQALRLAEEAIQLAPGLPDGHAVLGRLILCHADTDALVDAMEVLQHALQIDAEHDPAEVALAVALWAKGERVSAQDAVERVIKRGNALPQPLLLRALLALAENRVDDARRDIERAVRLAPAAGQFCMDAADIAERAGDAGAAALHRAEASRLLGEAYERFEVARRGAGAA